MPKSRLKMIEFKNVYFKYPEFCLKDLNFVIDKGEIVAITGNNATGKTTLVKLLSRVTSPKKGELLVDDVPIKKSGIKIGVVFQNPDNQIIFNKVYDDICFTLKNMGVDKSKFDERVDYALDLVKMSDYKYKDTFTLSTGQKQRIAIANMLAIKPDLIIFDESTVYLDPATKQLLYALFLRLKQDGTTVVFTTNFLDEIIYADRVLILKNGELVADKKRAELLKNLDVFRNLNMPIPFKLKLIEKMQLDTTDDQEILDELEKR